MNIEVRKLLIESARKNQPLAYSNVMKQIGLDHREEKDRYSFSRIMEDISRFEHSKGRPMLSAQITYKGSGEIGKKFYWLASDLKHGKQKELKARAFEVEMMVRCHEFWKDEHRYETFIKDSGDEHPKDFKSNFLNQTPLPIAQDAVVSRPESTFSGIDVDWLKIAEENILLGSAGEQLVIKYEKESLIAAGQRNLADLVIKVKDGKGYDILSFYGDGQEKYIEVKTTKGGNSTSFFVTLTELNCSKRNLNCYHLYRIFNFVAEKKPNDFFEFKGALDTHFNFESVLYRARL